MKAFEKVHSSFGQQKFMNFIGATLTEVGSGFCEIRLKYSEDLTQQNQYFHAGVISSIADTAGGFAAYSLMKPWDSVLTVEYKINLLAPAKGKILIARSEVQKAGKTLTVCLSKVFTLTNNQEQLCATALVTLIALKNYATKLERERA